MADGDLTLNEFWRLTERDRCERYKELSDHDKFGVRQAMDPGTVSVPCNNCIYKHEGKASCEAYPEGLTAEHIQAVMDDLSAPCGRGFKYKKKTD